MNCDEYYSYNALAGLVKSGEEEVVKKDPWDLVTEAITRMKRNGDVMRADRLKQVMQQIDSSFDEKNVGMSKFSRFVTEAAHKGLLTLTKLENGQLEVAPRRRHRATLPAGRKSHARPESPAPPKKGDNRADHVAARRGGRGRDREGRGPRTAAPSHRSVPAEVKSQRLVSRPDRLLRRPKRMRSVLPVFVSPARKLSTSCAARLGRTDPRALARFARPPASFSDGTVKA